MAVFEKRFLAYQGSFGPVMNRLAQDHLEVVNETGLDPNGSLPADFLELVGN